MNLRTTLLLASVLLIALAATPGDVHACACCSSEGAYYSGQQKLSEHLLSQILMMRFKPTAGLITGEMDVEEAGAGLIDPAESYALTGSFVGKVWKLTFRNGARNGVLSLALPSKIWTHSVDIHDGRTSPGGGPLLYKEWRLEGTAGATGIMNAAGGNRKLKYNLVLLGRGNGCDDALDFTHWRLAVSGSKVDYALHGELDAPVP
jgi:hypothetical protein